MAENSTDAPSRMARWRGTLKNIMGWATGDRRVEAEGAVQEIKGEVPTEAEVDRAEKAVKREHRDMVDSPLPPET